MDPNAQEDEQFMKWILSETAKPKWEFDENGPRWEKAQTEYNRISGLQENSESDLKVREPTHSIENNVVPYV